MYTVGLELTYTIILVILESQHQTSESSYN